MASRRKAQSRVSDDFKFADAEQEAKYELELTWCIQKLTLGISSEKDKNKGCLIFKKKHY
jgi:hypothetical protein